MESEQAFFFFLPKIPFQKEGMHKSLSFYQSSHFINVSHPQ